SKCVDQEGGDARSNYHPRDNHAPPWKGSELLAQKIGKPAKTSYMRKPNRRRRHSYLRGRREESPRMTTTADSPRRKTSDGCASMRTRTGNREARCTQLRGGGTAGGPGGES